MGLAGEGGRCRGRLPTNGNEQCGNKFPFCARLMQISDTRRAGEAARGAGGGTPRRRVRTRACMLMYIGVCQCLCECGSVALHAHTYKFNESHL